MAGKRAGTFLFVLGLFLAMAIVIVSGGEISGTKEVFQRNSGQGNNQDIHLDVSVLTAEDGIDFSSVLVELTNDEGQNYFVNYRIKREQLRQEAKEMLQPLLEAENEATRAQAQAHWLELGIKIALESELENVVKMRGFQDAVSEVNSGKVKVTILAEELQVQEVNKIISIVADITGFPPYTVEVLTRA